MPRRSEASLTIAHIGPGARRLEPPPRTLRRLKPQSSGRWSPASRTIIFPPRTAIRSPPIAGRSRLSAGRAKSLRPRASLGSQASPWLAVYATAVRALSTLTVRLRLGPKARHPNNTRRLSKSVSPPSYYDTMTIAAEAATASAAGRAARMAPQAVRLRRVDREALERAIALRRAAGGIDALQMQRMLKEDPWLEAGAVCGVRLPGRHF